ncbi:MULTISPECIES: hypothetical protein [Elizabethkingia]|uniref:hypothetical protein n=1 Tax=Elizabethkingia TaxID=308865 RepID=UPI0009992028|nr:MULTISPECIES: hypothetical protein [Elizabethkingia]MCL1663559.1 hypothetical protein [Elizabethkingia ursingii]MDX8569062.1 hypothetical protein [Elizabethkingia sp. HX XZB]MDX8571738.1 hypothetical protein [Elizabethkingia sp. HX QKY]OPC07845.1 hypothetical protein BAY01_15700 [Elizabethkingia miricola]OPC40697.1 hypothetical protein BAX99_02235 [Elizabethkingia miricola]
MKTIKLEEVAFNVDQLLTRDQLKNVFAGAGSVISITGGGENGAPCLVLYECYDSSINTPFYTQASYCDEAIRNADSYCKANPLPTTGNPHTGHPHP